LPQIAGLPFTRIFPILFIGLWLAVTSILAVLSGWFVLMRRYPDDNAEPILKVPRLSGKMGMGVHMSGVLTLSVCSSGLRVAMTRIFGPFSRSFLVPWSEIGVTRERAVFFGPVADLRFGYPPLGTLRISGPAADRLARAAAERWPEPGPFPEERRAARVPLLLSQWLLMTSFAAGFFIIVPRVVAPRGAWPPIAVAILFPAVVFGIGCLVRFLRGVD
jgi:hypothetical protein